MTPAHFMSNIGDSLAGTAAALDKFSRNQLAPAMEEAGKTLDGLGKNAAAAFDDFGKNKLGPAVSKTRIWIQSHPGQTAMLSTSIVSFVMPALLSGPLLMLLGWGDAGVRAGSAIAAVQSSIGNVAAGSAFATLQSAGMGGYGVAVVHGFTSIGAAGFGGVVGFSNVFEKGKCDKVARVDDAMKESAVGGEQTNGELSKVKNGSNVE